MGLRWCFGWLRVVACGVGFWAAAAAWGQVSGGGAAGMPPQTVEDALHAMSDAGGGGDCDTGGGGGDGGWGCGGGGEWVRKGAGDGGPAVGGGEGAAGDEL